MTKVTVGSLVASLGLLAGMVPLAAWSDQAGATTSKSTETARCVADLSKRQTVTKSVLAACSASSLVVRHPCPKGSSTIFVVRRGTTYALRVGHKPLQLPKQYGMGTITQACGYTMTSPGPAPTVTTGGSRSPAPTTTPPASSRTTVPQP